MVIKHIQEWATNYETLIGVFSAFSPFIISILVTYITWQQLIISKNKRQDDLFDRRYDFYKRLRSFYLNHFSSQPTQFDPDSLSSFAEESEFLFGNDIGTHIMSFRHLQFDDLHVEEGNDWLLAPTADNYFVQPFKKYLKLRH